MRRRTGRRARTRVDTAVGVGGLRGARTADKLRLTVVSGFEVACLDALGKSLGLPVHALLGGKVRDGPCTPTPVWASASPR